MTRTRTLRPAAAVSGTTAAAAPRVGVLSLQGDFQKHSTMLATLGCEPVRVSLPVHMVRLDALILPGGESSTMLRLLEHTGLRAPIEKWVRSKPVLGTCAGLILLAKTADHLPRPALGAIDIDAERNGWGRQVHSFTDAVNITPLAADFTGVFIRAPRIQRVGRAVQVIATYHGEPVGVRQGNAVAITFHPELTDDMRLHAWFLAEVAGLRIRQPQEAR
ncbi:MAG: pyridoxal 5'-phosphate synthase glutaminase subunit PdxT [Candidatus Eisenbacteria bacterium]